MKADIERFLDQLRSERQSSQNTVTAYRTDLVQFQRALTSLAGHPVGTEHLDHGAVIGYVRWLEERGYRPATIARKMVAVRSFLAADSRPAVAALAAELRPPPTPKKQPRVLSPEEYLRLRRAPAELATPRGLRDTALLDLLYVTGMRASEVTELNLEHLDLEAGQVLNPHAAGRWLPLGSARGPVQRYLEGGRTQLVRKPTERALFVNLRGKRLSRQGLWLVVKRWAESAGLETPISPHSLRHSMAHAWLSQGKSRRELQRALGLSSPGAIRVRSKPSARDS